jgi:hypothetical protein
VVVLLEIFLFEGVFFDFGWNLYFLSSTCFPFDLTRRFLLVKRTSWLGNRRSTVLVELIVITTILIKSILIEEVAVWIYEGSVLVDVETCLVILASWRVPLLIILFLFQVLWNLIQLSGVLRCAWSSLLN